MIVGIISQISFEATLAVQNRSRSVYTTRIVYNLGSGHSPSVTSVMTLDGPKRALPVVSCEGKVSLTRFMGFGTDEKLTLTLSCLCAGHSLS